MNKAFLAGTGIALIGLGGFAAWQAGAIEKLTDRSHGANAACEETLVKGLRSPSTYNRISVAFTPAGPLTYEEFVGYQDTQGCPAKEEFGIDSDTCVNTNRLVIAAGAMMDWQNGSFQEVRKFSKKARTEYLKHLFDLYRKRPTKEQQTAFVQVDYDAANAYGTPVRSTHVCRFGPRGSGNFEPRDMFTTSVDAMD